MIVRKRVVKLATELIPDAVLGIFTSGHNKVVGGVPVTGKHNTIVSFPLNLLVSWQGWLNNEVLVTAVKNSITVWGPYKAVDRLSTLDNLGTEHTATRPGLDLTILSGSCKSAFITPLDADNGGHVSLSDALFDATSLADKFEGAIAAGKGENLLVSLAW